MNNRLIKLIKRDLIFGFSKNKYKFLLTILIFTILSFINLVNIKHHTNAGQSIGLADLIFEMFKGCGYENYKIIPTNWIIINIYISFLIGNYYYEDIAEESSHMIVKMKNRKNIWISKVIWMIVTVITFYLIVLAIITITAIINKNTSLDISNIKLTYQGLNNISSGYLFTVIVIGMYILTSLTISIIQMLLSCIIKPAYMYVSIVFSMAASFSIKPFIFPTQSSLILRQYMFDSSSKINVMNSIGYNAILFVAVFVIGIIFIKKFDMLKSQMTD